MNGIETSAGAGGDMEDAMHAKLARRRKRIWTTGLAAAPFVFAATLTLGLAVRRQTQGWLALPLAAVVLLAAAMVLVVAGAVWHFVSEWKRSLKRLENLVALAAAGEAPIEELATMQGGWRGLAGRIQELLREIKRQKAQLASLEADMKQRLAQRTDSLERVMGSLRAQANRDALTGLYNRRMLENHLPSVVEQCKGTSRSLCVLMLDLDNFKTLNDTLGHAAGDELLRSVGQIIRSAIREDDLGFRFGGDEFVVVLPGMNAAAGRALAKRLMSLIDALGKTVKLPKPVGASIGMSSLSDATDRSAAQLLELADQRLYAMKQARKNRHAA